MARWHATSGDILNTTADGLICSANPSLNLSGGVGGAILLRYGNEMQEFLHRYLREQKMQFVAPGSVVMSPPFGSQFNHVAHAVAIDAFYDTSSPRILATYKLAIEVLLKTGCRSIVAVCLGCGYGRVTPQSFVGCVEELITLPFPELADFTFVSTNQELISLIIPSLTSPGAG